MLYPIIALNLLCKSKADSITSKVSTSIKNLLGLNPSLAREKLYGWLHELTPQEKADLSLLRTIKKLIKAELPLQNHEFLLGNIKNIPGDMIVSYLQDETSIGLIKDELLMKRSQAMGLTAGKPFETLNAPDLNWLKLATKELDIYRWKDKLCAHCELKLTTEHLLTCRGTKDERDKIKEKIGDLSEKVLFDPSVLNSLDKNKRKNTKSFIANKISTMILSAERIAR